MVDLERLRPLERRIQRLLQQEVPVGDIALRFRRTPGFIHRVIEMSELSSRRQGLAPSSVLRPVERRVLRWRDEGASHADIAPRFNRSPEFVEQVENLARYKLAR